MSRFTLEQHQHYMTLAMLQARLAWQAGEIPVGAVIVDSTGAVAGQGHNRTLTGHDPTAHAEIMALREAGQTLGTYRLLGTTLYVTLEPCCMCAGAMIHSRIETLVYAAPDPKTGACGSVFNVLGDERHNHRVEIIGGVMEEECRELLQSFFRMRRAMHKQGRDYLKERGLSRDWQQRLKP